jgi:hypothetical protein
MRRQRPMRRRRQQRRGRPLIPTDAVIRGWELSVSVANGGQDGSKLGVTSSCESREPKVAWALDKSAAGQLRGGGGNPSSDAQGGERGEGRARVPPIVVMGEGIRGHAQPNERSEQR